MAYLNVDEVESALTTAAGPPNSGFTELIELPNVTNDGRHCHAIRVSGGAGAAGRGVYLLGGVHAREWGSPDILINFVEQVSDAYRSNSGLTIGGKTFGPTDIKRIVEGLDIVVFPQANPDGRAFSMTTDAMWRKNRRPPSSPGCQGVDINRNYDFLWDYQTYYSGSAAVQSSTDPCDYQVYIGPSAASEPETQNVVWLMDRFPNVGFFIDVHSYGEDILYSWGDDEDQTTDPSMNFQNTAYNGQRGISGDAYGEFIPSDDLTRAVALANSMAGAIQAVRGRAYTVEPSFKLYPTSGTSDDYAFSRHFSDASKGKILSYVIEWGSPTNPTPFHPPYAEMQHIIDEVTAGLVQFCIAAADT